METFLKGSSVFGGGGSVGDVVAIDVTMAVVVVLYVL